MLFTLCKSLCTDAQPLCITGTEAGSILSAITMPNALISAQGSYSFQETHSSGKEPCQCPLDHGNPSLALVTEELIQSKKTICWWPKFVMPYFACSVVWSIMVAYLRLIRTGGAIRVLSTENDYTFLYAAFIT